MIEDAKMIKTPEKPIVDWGEDKIQWLRKNLDHVSTKLRNIDKLALMHQIEKPDISMEELIKRLRKRKNILIKQFSSIQKSDPNFLRNYSIRSRMSEKYPSGLYPTLENTLGKLKDGLFKKEHCEVIVGSVWPTWFYNGLGIERNLHHGSTTDYGCWAGEFCINGQYLDTAELVDDASIWRDDNPDSYKWGDEITWILPQTACDCVVECNIGVTVYSDFTNSADDGGSGYHSAQVAHTDPVGNWASAKYQMYLDTGPILEMSSSGMYGPASDAFELSFVTEAGKTPMVALCNMTYLKAQDGLVHTFGHWKVNAGYIKPYLVFTMTPF